MTFETDVYYRKDCERKVLLSKHKDYGPKNIAESPGGALNGLRVRLHDKLARVNNLLDSGADPHHEGLIDTALDIANYGTIMALVLAGEWPGVEGDSGPVDEPEETQDSTDPRTLYELAWDWDPTFQSQATPDGGRQTLRGHLADDVRHR